LVSLDENYKQLEKSFPKTMKESQDLNIKETFQNVVVFSIKISFANFQLHHSVFKKW
jgi:hypothetical protein